MNGCGYAVGLASIGDIVVVRRCLVGRIRIWFIVRVGWWVSAVRFVYECGEIAVQTYVSWVCVRKGAVCASCAKTEHVVLYAEWSAVVFRGFFQQFTIDEAIFEVLVGWDCPIRVSFRVLSGSDVVLLGCRCCSVIGFGWWFG